MVNMVSGCLNALQTQRPLLAKPKGSLKTCRMRFQAALRSYSNLT
ncbi:hypothetical protein [Kingella sp. (in: b-proteobacteria)]|nr:hypothetical protein [Kingella sp. (in: b-proteobacteria)]MDO4657856.1 hypothetical protein [Kingella sp. (in: b-proteobacteria)]